MTLYILTHFLGFSVLFLLLSSRLKTKNFQIVLPLFSSMAFNHRKMLVSYLPGKDFNLTISIPFIQILYPPPPPPPPPPQKDLSVLVTTSVCAAGSTLLFLFLVGFLYHYFTKTRPSSTVSVAFGDTNREENEAEKDERDFSDIHHVWRINTVGLHRSTIDSITVVLFKKEEGIIDGTECSVCLNEFEEDESLRLLPKCSHAFHINCIDTWLLSHRNCPLCRAPVLLHTDPTHQVTKVNHLQDTGSRNDLSGGQVRSESRDSNILPRAQSDLSNHCGVGRIEYVRRSYSVGESLSLCDGDNIATRSRSHFPTRLSTYLSSRRSRNNDQVLPNQMPNLSGSTS